MKPAFIYSLKIWLTTLLLTPALRLLIAWIFNLPTLQFNTSPVTYYLMAVYAGAIFSIPGAIFLWIFTWQLNQRPISLIKKKLCLSAITFVETILTFYFVFWLPKSLADNFIMTLPYCIIATAGIWFYKLKPAIASQSVI